MEKEPVSTQAAIAAAIRKGETWRGMVEMDCRGGEAEFEMEEQGGTTSVQ